MIYTIRRGDTLAILARRYGVSVLSILAVNPGMNARRKVSVGQQIVIHNAEFFMRPTFAGGFRPTLGDYAGRLSATRDSLSDHFDNIASEKNAQPAWMATAIGEIGVAEYAGMHRANPRIMEYFKASKYWGTDDTSAANAWCGSFAAWVMKQNGFEPVAKAYRAKEWKNFGKVINSPVCGALGIKTRTGGGHVSFVVGQNAAGNKLFMLGGNQDDKVQIKEYEKDVWETFVVPTTYDDSTGALPVYTGVADAAGGES